LFALIPILSTTAPPVAISIFVLFGPKIRFFSGVDVSMLILNHFKTSPSDVQMRILKIRLFARAMMSYVCFAMFHVRVRILICLHVLAHITNSLQRVLPFEKVFGIWTQKRAFSKVVIVVVVRRLAQGLPGSFFL